MAAKDVADDVLNHSEDADEWDDEPVEIERRPSGNQVVSVRLPTELAHKLFALASRRHCRPSEAVRFAVEQLVADDVPFAIYQAMGSASPFGPAVSVHGAAAATAWFENTNLVIGDPWQPVQVTEFA